MNVRSPAIGPGVAILVGGGSTRMGQAKQLLSIAGESLLSRMFERTRAVADTVVMVGGADEGSGLAGLSPSQRRAATWLPDATRGIGPAGGVLAALRHNLARDWLVLGCDMPLVSKAALDWLLALRQGAPQAEAWCGRRGGRIEPLPAIYASRCAPHLQAVGARGLHAAIERASAHIADIPADLTECWTNVNTPDEWEALKRRKGQARL